MRHPLGGLRVSVHYPAHIEACIEAICQKGCRVVWDCISALEEGRELPETSALETSERRVVLSELRSIMAAYSGSCDPAGPDPDAE